jgi:Golgi SNAP receptor complex protein 2
LIAAGLDAFEKHLGEYEALAKREMIYAKQQMALAYTLFHSDEMGRRIQKLKEDRLELEARLERAKNKSQVRVVQEAEREQLLYPTSNGSTTIAMQDMGEREGAFMDRSEVQLDDYIAQGRAALSNLVEQRTILKSTQRKVLDAANTLGLSRSVIQFIERRSTQDKYIFTVGIVVSILLMWAMVHYWT